MAWWYSTTVTVAPVPEVPPDAPVPLTPMVTPAPPLRLTTTLPLRLPEADGLNATLNLQVPPPAVIVPVHGGLPAVMRNSAVLVLVRLTLVALAVPTLVTVTAIEALVLPTVVEPKTTGAGAACRNGRGGRARGRGWRKKCRWRDRRCLAPRAGGCCAGPARSSSAFCAVPSSALLMPPGVCPF